MSDNTCYCIGLDLGTSAIKGVLIDSQGRVLAEAVAATSLLRPHDGWVEVDPEQHYQFARLSANWPPPLIAKSRPWPWPPPPATRC